MPIQAPQWTEFLSCPVCQHEFAVNIRPPISLGCGHTICRTCLATLHRRQCPLDQATITTELDNLPINYALLQLVNNSTPTTLSNESEIPSLSVQSLNSDDLQCYNTAKKCIEELALYLKPFSNGSAGNLLSRPMQRKLVTLINCQLIEDEGRSRALRAARSLGERTVTELILQHQNPQQLSANLWAAVRQRGCQFLGPAMQEEVLKLVLLALEDGSPLSRKVLVMFVVQRLEPQFPQASKTSIGHVVQLLYRASCFKVSKREGDSSLMQLKEEFRTYEALRREHDAQIVQIATEAGLRIAPDQWSALLYGDTAHKSHMQSIIDKLQTPQSFNQSVQELVIALQRTNDPAQLSGLRTQLKYLANIDSTTENNVPSWCEVADALTAVKQVVIGLVEFVQHHGNRKLQESGHSSHNTKYKISMCRDLNTRGTCPRGSNCTFAHSEEELEKYRNKSRKITSRTPNPNMKEMDYQELMLLQNNNFIPSEETSPMRFQPKSMINSPKLIQQQFGDKLPIPASVPNLNSIAPRGPFDHYNNINFQPPIPPPLPPVQTIPTAIAPSSTQTSPMSQNQRGNTFRPIMNSTQNYQQNFQSNNMPPNNASQSPVFTGNPKNYSPELYANSVQPHNMMSGNALSSPQQSMPYPNAGKMNPRLDMMRQNMLWDQQQQQQQHHLHQHPPQPPPNQQPLQHNMHLKPSPANPMYLSPTSSGNSSNSNRSPPGRNPNNSNMNMNLLDQNHLEYFKGMQKYSKIPQPPTASTSASMYGNGVGVPYNSNNNNNNNVLLKDDMMGGTGGGGVGGGSGGGGGGGGGGGPSYWTNAQQNQHQTAFQIDSGPPVSLKGVFLRSDSILNEDDYVEFEAQPTSNKFGPISRVVGKCSDPSHACLLTDADDNLMNNNYPPYWYLNRDANNGPNGPPPPQSNHHQMAAPHMTHVSKVLNNNSCDDFLPSLGGVSGADGNFSTYPKIDGITGINSNSTTSSKIQEDVSRLEQKISELRLKSRALNDMEMKRKHEMHHHQHQHHHHGDCDLDKDNTDIKIQSINSLAALQNQNDDNCEVGLVKQMHALELRIESEVLE